MLDFRSFLVSPAVLAQVDAKQDLEQAIQDEITAEAARLDEHARIAAENDRIITEYVALWLRDPRRI